MRKSETQNPKQTPHANIFYVRKDKAVRHLVRVIPWFVAISLLALLRAPLESMPDEVYLEGRSYSPSRSYELCLETTRRTLDAIYWN